MIRALLIGATILVLAAPAAADAPLPSWSRYQADRSIQLGWLALATGDTPAAEEHATRALGLDGDHVEAWRLRTETLMVAGRWDDASAAALQLTGLLPDDLGAALAAGRISLELGVKDSAVAEYRRAARLDIGDARAELGLAMVAARLDGDWEAFERHLRTALQRDPDLALATLPLQDGWTGLADDEDFLAALTRVLRGR